MKTRLYTDSLGYHSLDDTGAPRKQGKLSFTRNQF